MVELNHSQLPAMRGQDSPNQRVSQYGVGKLPSDLGGDFVAKETSSGWASPTGTAERTTFTTYTAPTISNPPTQAEVQAVADAVQILSRRMKALVDDLKSSGVI